MTTQSQVRNDALIKLGAGSLTQTPTSALNDDMQRAYDAVYEQLEELDLTFWGQTSDVPTKIANEIATLMAWSRVTNYGVSGPRYQRLLSDVSLAIPAIRAISIGKYTSAGDVEDF